MPQATYNTLQIQNTTKINELQESVRPLAQNLLRLAADQGIQLKIVSAYRSPEQQQALKDSGRGVTNLNNIKFHECNSSIGLRIRFRFGLLSWL